MREMYISPSRYGYDNDVYFYGNMAGVSRNGKWGFINREGTLIVPLQYDDIEIIDEGFAFVTGVMLKVNGRPTWGLINNEGKQIIPVKYDEIDLFNGGLARVRLNGHWGLVDEQGVEVAPTMYSEKEIVQLKALVATGEYSGTQEQQYREAHEEFQNWKKNKGKV